MSHKKFFEMLDRVPRITHLWDKETQCIDLPSFESELYVLSSGETQIAKFFASVWFGDNERFGFDLADAMASIDDAEKQIIIDWMNNPFWP